MFRVFLVFESFKMFDCGVHSSTTIIETWVHGQQQIAWPAGDYITE